MRNLCALILAAIVASAICSPAVADKKNPDQDKTNAKKQDQWKPLPGYYTLGRVRNFCRGVGGKFDSANMGTSINYACSWGCGTGGCNAIVDCNSLGMTGKAKNIGECSQRGGNKSPLVADTGSSAFDSSILDNGPPLSVNQPSRTGTPKQEPPAPPAPPPPPPNPG